MAEANREITVKITTEEAEAWLKHVADWTMGELQEMVKNKIEDAIGKQGAGNRIQDTGYRDYVDEHVANVQRVWDGIQEHLQGEFWIDELTWWQIDALIKEHDDSKISAQEFEGYRQWFFPAEGETKNKTSFAYAWNHHQKHNPHHWQYWLMWDAAETTALDMPFVYVFEMLCDWTAMSLKFGDTPSEFYAKNNGKMLLSLTTIRCVEKWLPVFDKCLAPSCSS